MKKHCTLLLPLIRQFTIILIIFFLCTTCITAYSIQDYARLSSSLLNQSLESFSAQLAKSAKEAYESYENICYNVAYSPAVQNYLKNTDICSDYEYYLQLETQLNNTALLNPYIIDVAVYGQDGRFAALTGAETAYRPFAKLLTSSRFPYRAAGIALINNISCHILEMPIYSLDTGENSFLGILYLAIDINSLLGNSLDYEEKYNPQILFVDEHNTLTYGDSALYASLSAGKRNVSDTYGEEPFLSNSYAITAYSIPNIGHTLYVLIDKSIITRQVAAISARQLAGMGAMIGLVLFFLFLLYRPLIRSLKQLTDFMNTISAGDRKALKEGVSIHQGVIGSSEIDAISTAFNDMLLQTDKLNHTIFNTCTRMYELENNNRKTEIAFLRSQINPHFLYNTLTMICGMAAEGMTDKIISVTGALSQIFRYSIKGNDMVSLREEMDIVKSYLMIQESRFEDRFRVRYEFSEDSLCCLIPKMVIQPLVENSIVHGLEKSLDPGELLIGAGRNPEHGYLAIWIYDTGVGMPEKKLLELRQTIKESAKQKTGDAVADFARLDTQNHDSIGILNVNSRMVLYYGTDYTLLIDSEEGVGTNIQIRIPYQTE